MAEPLKLGLIGAGSIAGAHLKAVAPFADRVRYTAVCDVVEENARKRAELAPGAAVFTDLKRMLAEADIDAVDICTVHDQHKEAVLAAARAGKHVLVEKPMACSLADCRKMVAACAKVDVAFMVAQCERFEPTYAGLKRLIDAGEFGRIRAVRIDAMQNIPAMLPAGHWLYDGKKAGGGILISVAVHRLDLARHLVGDIKRVSAQSQAVNPDFTQGAEDLVLAHLEFENGAWGQLFATWNAYRLRYSENLMIFGDDGAAHCLPAGDAQLGPAMAATRRRVPPAQGWPGQFGGFLPVEPDPSLPSSNSFANEILHFADCCRSGEVPLTSGQDNLKTMATVFAIYESARRGQPVEVERL